jgi:hypothetical protein
MKDRRQVHDQRHAAIAVVEKLKLDLQYQPRHNDFDKAHLCPRNFGTLLVQHTILEHQSLTTFVFDTAIIRNGMSRLL